MMDVLELVDAIASFGALCLGAYAVWRVHHYEPQVKALFEHLKIGPRK